MWCKVDIIKVGLSTNITIQLSIPFAHPLSILFIIGLASLPQFHRLHCPNSSQVHRVGCHNIGFIATISGSGSGSQVHKRLWSKAEQ